MQVLVQGASIASTTSNQVFKNLIFLNSFFLFRNRVFSQFIPRDILLLILKARFSRVKEINLTGCVYINDETVDSICKICDEIISLNVSDCFHVQDNSLKTITSHLTGLQYLSLRGDAKYCNQTLSKLTSKNFNLCIEKSYSLYKIKGTRPRILHMHKYRNSQGYSRSMSRH